MFPLSAAAEEAFKALILHYAALGRDRAIDRLIEAIEMACVRYRNNKGQFYDAPRPYPDLTRYGLRWTKEGPYWIAFRATAEGVVVAGIFHATADIPNRL